MGKTPDTAQPAEHVPGEPTPEEMLEAIIIEKVGEYPEAVQPLYPGSAHEVIAFAVPETDTLILIKPTGKIEDGYFMVRPLGPHHREPLVDRDVFSFETYWTSDEDRREMVAVVQDLKTAVSAEPSQRLQQEMLKWVTERWDNFRPPGAN